MQQVALPRTSTEEPLTFCWLERPPLGENDDDAEGIGANKRLLSQDEKERADQFRFRADHHAYVTAHALLRKCLSHYGDLPPEEWVFAKNRYGCPAIANRQHQATLEFSLSHTIELVACVVTFEGRCGVDVEKIGRVPDPLQLAESNFSAVEIDALLSAKDTERDELFTALWCLKEAYLKAKGLGLYAPLDIK
jgi:4'-phosphopantetheinyl transferase